MAALNDRIGSLPKEGAVLIVTSSYNGKPPSNAGQFVQWLEELKPDELKGVQYAVFGCGDHNWASTYQRIPRYIDEQMAQKEQQGFLNAEKQMQVVILRNSSSNGNKVCGLMR